MTLALRQLGLDPRPTLFEAFPPRYALLRDGVSWHRWDQSRDTLAAQCDALAIFDTCSLSQLEPIANYLPLAPRTLVIDHHPSHDAIANRPGDLRLCDETAGAVCLILAEWIKAVGIPLSPSLATALLVGIATDCGWFRFPNTDARVMKMAAELVAAGAVPNTIWASLHEQDQPAKLRLIGRMLDSLRLYADDRLAVMTLRAADFAAVGADHTMTEDLINEAGRLGCTEATVLFTEEPDGSVRINFRSKRSLDVAALAGRFNGGGHTRAAGARPPGAWDEVVPRVIAATIASVSRGDVGT